MDKVVFLKNEECVLRMLTIHFLTLLKNSGT